MPTVPPTFPTDEVVFHGIADQILVPGAFNGPTPDPDMDDVVLVPVVTGDGMGAITSKSSLDSPPAHTNSDRKFRLSLTGLALHSPSSIVGTPFDISEPKFEYPFPASPPDPDFYQGASYPTFSGHISTFVSSSAPPLAHASACLNRQEAVRVFPPTRPKHVLRDPPVPPSLAKKKWSVGIVTPPPQLKPTTHARTASVRTEKGERGTTDRVLDEDRKPALVRMSAPRGAAQARRASPGRMPDDGPLPEVSKRNMGISHPAPNTRPSSVRRL